MLKQETYQKIVDEFGAPVGVAHILNTIDIRKMEDKVERRVSSKEWESNRIITDWVLSGVYESNWRRVWNLKKSNPKLSSNTIYKRINASK